MNSKDDFMGYIAEQVMDYVSSQTSNSKPFLPQDMKVLEEGVAKICIAGYPEQKDMISLHASKLVRAVLNPGQLSLADKVLKIFDPANSPKKGVIPTIMNKITQLKSNEEVQQEVSKSEGWVNKIKSSKSKSQVYER